MKTEVLVLGLGGILLAGGIYWLAKRKPIEAEEIVSLTKGGNTVVYLGPMQPVEDAVASILPYVSSVSWSDGEITSIWAPGRPYNTLTHLVKGETYNIYVTQACMWTLA